MFYICWLAASYAARKFERGSYLTFKSGLIYLSRSALYMMYCISFAVVFLGLPGFSRLQILSTCLVLFVLECLSWAGYLFLIRTKMGDSRDAGSGEPDVKTKKESFSISLFWMDFLLMVVAFFTANYIKRGHIHLLPYYEQLFLLNLGLWFVVSFATGKFSGNANRTFYYSLAQWIKTGLAQLAVVAVVLFGVQLLHFSRFQSFGAIVILMGYETIALWFYFKWRKAKKENLDVESIEEVKSVLGQEKIVPDVDVDTLRQRLLEPVRDNLKDKLGKKDNELFEFIDSHIDLEKIICMETTADNSRKVFSLTAGQIPIRLFLNLRKLNNERRINQYFLDIHQTLVPGGYFVGRAHTITTHKNWIFEKYSKRIAKYVYFVDFCLNRVLPKLPWIKKLYFAVTGGKNRVISKAEILGRLSFCGFEIVAEKAIGKRLCVIARKIKTPAVDANPTYGPFIELKRVGYNHEVVKVYKMRTMHPYSEYLQDYVFKQAGLQKGGKLQDDFRTAEWGKVMRKLWLDELPMLYNWIKGDIQLVGVRPLSLQYFSLYDRELQEMRGLVKPGLVPPFYVDMPETFDEIVESEKRYIRSFLKNPVRTQIYYFWNSWNSFINIVFKGARSK